MKRNITTLACLILAIGVSGCGSNIERQRIHLNEALKSIDGDERYLFGTVTIDVYHGQTKIPSKKSCIVIKNNALYPTKENITSVHFINENTGVFLIPTNAKSYDINRFGCAFFQKGNGERPIPLEIFNNKIGDIIGHTIPLYSPQSTGFNSKGGLTYIGHYAMTVTPKIRPDILGSRAHYIELHINAEDKLNKSIGILQQMFPVADTSVVNKDVRLINETYTIGSK